MIISKYQKFTNIFLLITIACIINSCNKIDYKPKIDDVYIISLDEQSFTTWKITEIAAAEIWYVSNDYSVSKEHLVNSIDLESNYTDAPKAISKKAFNQKQNKYLIKKPK